MWNLHGVSSPPCERVGVKKPALLSPGLLANCAHLISARPRPSLCLGSAERPLTTNVCSGSPIIWKPRFRPITEIQTDHISARFEISITMIGTVAMVLNLGKKYLRNFRPISIRSGVYGNAKYGAQARRTAGEGRSFARAATSGIGRALATSSQSAVPASPRLRPGTATAL